MVFFQETLGTVDRSNPMCRATAYGATLTCFATSFLCQTSAWSFVGHGFHCRARYLPLLSRRLATSHSLPHMITSGSPQETETKPEFVKVSLPKPLGVQLEEVRAGFPGLRVSGLLDGGSAKEDGVSEQGDGTRSQRSVPRLSPHGS